LASNVSAAVDDGADSEELRQAIAWWATLAERESSEKARLQGQLQDLKKQIHHMYDSVKSLCA